MGVIIGRLAWSIEPSRRVWKSDCYWRFVDASFKMWMIGPDVVARCSGVGNCCLFVYFVLGFDSCSWTIEYYNC